MQNIEKHVNIVYCWQAYADCLAQAVYAIFARAFPASLHLFDSNFKQSLNNNTHEWVTGKC